MMKYMIIECDLCNSRIYRKGFLIDKGAVTFHVKELEMMEQGLTKDLEPVICPGWKRRRLHICPKCVDKIKEICKGGKPDENT